MSKINSDVLIKAESYIPIEIKQEALSWYGILFKNLPFIVTILIVLASAVVTFIISRKTIQTQENEGIINRKAEHEDKISDYRHEWLQNLRNTSSELVKVLHLCQLHNMRKNLSTGYQENATKHDQNVEKHSDDIIKHYSSFLEERANFYLLHAKIKMFFKVDDVDAEKLLSKLDEAKSNLINDKTYLDNDLIDNIISDLQVILKEEWEVTKKRSWVKNA